MDCEPSPPTRPGSLPDGAEAARFVRLTRFTVPPDQQADLVDAARAVTPSPAMAQVTECTLLVALDDGDWLEILITTDRDGPTSDAAYLNLAQGIVGDEDGTIITVAGRPSSTDRECLPGRTPGGHGQVLPRNCGPATWCGPPSPWWRRP